MNINKKLFKSTRASDKSEVSGDEVYFYDCVLLADVEDIPKGSTFECITINLRELTISLEGQIGDDPRTYSFSLCLGVDLTKEEVASYIEELSDDTDT
jgi:hypothetical protein